MTKILLVEDDKSLREIYGVRLLAEGYDIVSAGDGEEALAMAIKERPQLIVSDVMMPKISGFDMLDILRSTTETRDIKVIMMTALSSDDQRQRGQQLGADRYLVKSQVGIEDVVRTVHEVLGDLPGASAGPVSTQAPQPAPAPTPTAPAAAPARPEAPLAPPPRTPELMPAPAAPVPVPAPQATPTPPMPTTQAAAAQAPMPTMPTSGMIPPKQESSLPEPTAPFSTPRPANLGDRVIHPLEKQENDGPNIATQLARELGINDTPAPVVSPAPAPAPNMPQAPIPPPPAPSAPTSDHSLQFEETPLPPPPPTMPPTQNN